MVKKEIFQHKEVSESQQDQQLDLEEKAAQVMAKLTEKKRESHDVELNILSPQVENAEITDIRLEDDLEPMMKEIEELLNKFRRTVQKLNEQLSASEKNADDLKETLAARTREQESLSSKLDVLYMRDTEYKDQIAAFEVNIVRLETDAIKLKEEMSRVKSTSRALALTAEFDKDVDFNAAAQSQSGLPSISSESFRHRDIICKLQCQLEKLHKVLNSKGASVDQDLEGRLIMDLIQEFLANSSTLDTELEKNKSARSVEFSSHKHASSKKSEELPNLLAEMKKQSEAVQTVQNKTECTSSVISSKQDILQNKLDITFNTCESKMVEASKKLSLISSIRGNSLQHQMAVKSLLFDLDQSQHEINTLQKEIDKINSEVESSPDKLNKSQNRLTKHNVAEGEEVEEHKSKLEPATHRVDIPVAAASVSYRNIYVDAQVIEEEDPQTRDSLLLEKDETIYSLRRELESLKYTESQARILGEEVKQTLLEKEREVTEIRDETKMLRKQVEGLSKLQNGVSTIIAHYYYYTTTVIISLTLFSVQLMLKK